MTNNKTPKLERHVTVEHHGVIETEMGKRSVFIARHFENDKEVYSMGSLLPTGPSIVARAAHDHQQKRNQNTETTS